MLYLLYAYHNYCKMEMEMEMCQSSMTKQKLTNKEGETRFVENNMYYIILYIS